MAQADDNKYSLRTGYGLASESDLSEILTGDFGKHPRDLSVYFLDAGYLLKKDFYDLPIDVYAKAGLAYFNEDEFSDTMEATIYIKFYWNMDLFDNRVRFGLAEGLSYTLDTLETEYFEAKMDREPSSQFLNYLDISIDFDLGKLVHFKPLYETYVGYAIKHRSGVFGLFNGVHGGSNYNTFYLEKNF